MTYFSLPLLYSRALRVVLLFVAFFAATPVFSQTVLNRGDFAILAVNANLPAPNSSRDEISFVCFKDITTGTEIQVTDNGYSSCVTGLWSSGEGGAILRRTGATILKGTVITFRTTTPYVFVSPDNGWTVTDLSPTQLSSNLNMNSTTGDQIYFAQGGTWTELASMCNIGTAASGSNSRIGPNASFPGNSGRVLFGFSTSGAWVPGTSLGALDGKSGNSGLYPGMQCFSMAPTGGQAYNKYFGPLTATTQTEWIKRISNVNNWETYTQSNYPTADYNFIGMTIPISSGGDIPTAEWAAPSSSICATSPSINLNTLITTGASGGTWSGTGVTGNTFNPSGLNGNYDITYTINYVTTSGSCPIAQTNTITVAAVSAPVLNVTQPTCTTPASITVTSPTGSGFTYSINGGANYQASPVFTFGLSPNVYTIIVKNSNGCTNSNTATVNSAPGLIVPTFDPIPPICIGSAPPVLPATSKNGITGIWSNLSSVPGTSNTYVFNPTAGQCATQTTLTATLASPPPTPVLAEILPLTCVTTSGISVTSPATGVTYSIDGTTFGTNNLFLGLTPTQTYTVTVKNIISGCTSSNSITLQNLPTAPTVPVLTISQVPSCTIATGTITVTPQTGVTYSIKNEYGSGYEVLNQTSNVFSGLLPGKYTVTVTNSLGCFNVQSILVPVVPSAPATPLFTITQPTCTVATGSITVTAVSGITYTIGSNNFTTTTTINNLVPNSYIITATNSGGCITTTTAVVNAQPTPPAAPTVTTPITYCQNTTAAALTATGTNLLWYGSVAAGGTSSATAPTPVTTASGNTTYYVSQTVSGCESPRAAIVVSITAAPAAPTVTTPVSYCLNATATALTATGTGLKWYGTVATGGTVSATAPTPLTTTGGSTNYYVTQTVGSCESPRAAINVIVIATPAPTVVSPITFCQNTIAAALTATGTNLLWYGTNATGGTSNSTAPIPVTTTVGTTNYYVSQTVSGCESPRATIAVTIETFTISLSANPNPAFGGVAFNGQITANLPIASSIWQPSNLFVNNLSTQTIVAPDTSFTLIVTGVSANGCRSTASRLVTVVPSNNTIFIPNALTPAAVGTDASVVKVYGTTVKTAQLLVYNQWGQLIFQTDSATTKGWDGTFNGKAQPSGVYTYVVRVVYQNNKVETKSGAINLIR